MTDKNIVLSEYQEEVHKSGRIMYLITYAFILLMPIGASLVFNAWPNFSEFLAACAGVVPTFWTVGFIEAFTYMPMLGGAGSYLSFITGNVTNIKVPAALQAMDIAEVKQGTEEGEVISTIAVGISSLVTLAVIILFVVMIVPLTPILTNPTLKPAFDCVLPALFGGLMVAFIVKDPKVGAPIIIFGALLFILFPSLEGIYPVITPVMVLLSVGLARLLYKKGKIN